MATRKKWYLTDYVWEDNMYKAGIKKKFKTVSAVLYLLAFMVALTGCFVTVKHCDSTYMKYSWYIFCAALWCALVLRGFESEFKNTAAVVSATGAALVFIMQNILEVIRAGLLYISLADINHADVVDEIITCAVFGLTIFVTVKMYKKAEYKAFMERVYSGKRKPNQMIFPVSVIEDKQILIRPAVCSDVPFLIDYFRNRPEYKGDEDFYIARQIENMVFFPDIKQRFYMIVYKGKTVGYVEVDTYISTRISIYIKPIYTWIMPTVFNHMFNCRMFVKKETAFVNVIVKQRMSNWLCRIEAEKDPDIKCRVVPGTTIFNRYYNYTKLRRHKGRMGVMKDENIDF